MRPETSVQEIGSNPREAKPIDGLKEDTMAAREAVHDAAKAELLENSRTAFTQEHA
ncbi:hypothetical protein NM963_01980 [Agrobacterium tumefaciens]|uniref:hypothetical protein n=1 Tax=Agrobacterium tumefaciens TaxID=358 RepID=UPI00224206C6|nr:hypothetical protein [Agrobacterium tumefaciens]MCW8142576.1 hypothetical protein [Agrobacterium tumefaciens]